VGRNLILVRASDIELQQPGDAEQPTVLCAEFGCFRWVIGYKHCSEHR
jgi:hypothetical protein